MKTYAYELLKTQTDDTYDVNFSMQILGSNGCISPQLAKWYVEKEDSLRLEEMSNEDIYMGLIRILKKRRTGRRSVDNNGMDERQMMLI